MSGKISKILTMDFDIHAFFNLGGSNIFDYKLRRFLCTSNLKTNVTPR